MLGLGMVVNDSSQRWWPCCKRRQPLASSRGAASALSASQQGLAGSVWVLLCRWLSAFESELSSLLVLVVALVYQGLHCWEGHALLAGAAYVLQCWAPCRVLEPWRSWACVLQQHFDGCSRRTACVSLTAHEPCSWHKHWS
jgi:hypothetical protein